MIGVCRTTYLVSLLILYVAIGNQVIADGQKEPARVKAALASPVGILLNASPGGRVMPWCTVSLTRPDTILTAHHCVTSKHSGDTLKVFFPYEGLREVDIASIEPFCRESRKPGIPNEPNGCSTRTDDLAILRLSAPYSLLQPLKPGQASDTTVGSKGSITGFGYHDEDSFEYGIRHEGEIFLDHCKDDSSPLAVSSADQSRALCFRFDWSIPGEVGIGPFDSGGPMFYVHEETGEKVIIGVARGSRPIYGTNGDVRLAKYVNLTNPFYQQWLAQEVFSRSFIPSPFSFEKLSTDDVRNLRPGTQADFNFDIKGLANRLILTLNHEPGPSMFPNNLDLKLPASLQANCDRYDSVEVCSVENPAAGTYRVSVVWGKQCQSDGQCTDPIYDAAYQMTAIALYDNPLVSAVGDSGARNMQSHNE